MNTTILKATLASLALMMSATVSASAYVYDKHSGSAARYGDFTIYNMTSATVSLSKGYSGWEDSYGNFLVKGQGTIQPYSAIVGTNLELDNVTGGNASGRDMNISIQEPSLKSGQTLVNNPNYQGKSYAFTLEAGFYSVSDGRAKWSVSYSSTPAWQNANKSTSGAIGMGLVGGSSQMYNSSYVVSLISCVAVDSTNGLDGAASGSTQIVLLIAPNFSGIFSQNAVANKFCPMISDDKDNQAAYNKF